MAGGRDCLGREGCEDRDVKASLLMAVGRALYGERWQTPLASDLGVTYRTLRRWVVDGDVPDRFRVRLRSVMTERLRAALAVRKLLWSRS